MYYAVGCPFDTLGKPTWRSVCSYMVIGFIIPYYWVMAILRTLADPSGRAV
jgi:hypothetical protein